MKQRRIEMEFPKGEAACMSLSYVITALSGLHDLMVLAGVNPNDAMIEGEIAIRYMSPLTEEEKDNESGDAGVHQPISG